MEKEQLVESFVVLLRYLSGGTEKYEKPQKE